MNQRLPVVLASLSAAMDGGFVAITDISEVMNTIGGVAVLLHIQRLGLDLPLRATGDADGDRRAKLLSAGRDV